MQTITRDALFEELAQRISWGEVVPVLGAGVSKLSVGSFLGWGELIKDGLEHLKTSGMSRDEDLKTARDLVEQKKLEDAADEMRKLFGRNSSEYGNWLRKKFEIDKGEVSSSLIEFIIALRCPILTTTNYDKLVSLIHPEIEAVRWNDLERLTDTLDKRYARKMIVHLHGIYTNPSSVILSSSDYKRLEESSPEYKTYHEVLRTIWLSHTLLFIGCSVKGLSDPHFTQLFNWGGDTFGNTPKKHYALVRRREFDQVDKVRELREKWLIQLVSYGDEHSDLLTYLKELGSRVSAIQREREPMVKESYRLTREISEAPALSSQPKAEDRVDTLKDLSVPRTPMFGRDDEIKEVVEWLKDPGVRLVVLHGTGGVGKTRIALAAAEELNRIKGLFDDGVLYVSLAALNDPKLVLQTILERSGTGPVGSESIDARLLEYLSNKKILLLLENFERVAPAASELPKLLAGAPHLKVLITSSTKLAIEITRMHDVRVAPLDVKNLDPVPPLEQLEQHPAVRLFVERAQVANSAFKLTNENATVVANVCQRLQGLPLAIELAAAQASNIAPEKMLEELDPAKMVELSPASDSETHRHQTLKAIIDWSYALLTPEEQKLFRRLGVFRGSRTVEAVEAVCNKEYDLGISIPLGLTSLLDKSLINIEVSEDMSLGGGTRFVMLETIHEYARDLLGNSGEMDDMQAQHAKYFLKLATRLIGEPSKVPQKEALDALEVEHDNLRAALEWALSSNSRESVDIALALGSALWRFWYRRGHLQEGQQWLEKVIRKDASPARAEVFNGLGALFHDLGKYEDAKKVFSGSLYIRELLDKKVDIARSLNNLGNVALAECDFKRARKYFRDSLDISRGQDDMKYIHALALGNLGLTEVCDKNYEEGRRYIIESLKFFEAQKDQFNVALQRSYLGLAELQGQELELAITMFHESLKVFRKNGSKLRMVECLENLASAATQWKQARRALNLFAAAENWRDVNKVPWHPHTKQLHQEYLNEARTQLGPVKSNEARQEGKRLTLDQAVEYALSDRADLSVP